MAVNRLIIATNKLIIHTIKRIIDRKKEENVKIWNINWQNSKSIEKYEEALNRNLRDIKFNNITTEDENIKKKIDDYYNRITIAFVNANNEVIEKLYKIKSNKNDWWTKEMTNLKENLKGARRKKEI
jgi:hypothetical protein